MSPVDGLFPSLAVRGWDAEVVAGPQVSGMLAHRSSSRATPQGREWRSCQAAATCSAGSPGPRAKRLGRGRSVGEAVMGSGCFAPRYGRLVSADPIQPDALTGAAPGAP